MQEFTVVTRHSCEFAEITAEINARVPKTLRNGLCHIFCPHTTAGLTVNENADPDVRNDLGAIFDRLVGERETYYTHTLEGDDDMPAHAKSTLTGVELTVPVTRGRLNLGTWQGIYLCEFRNRAPPHRRHNHRVKRRHRAKHIGQRSSRCAKKRWLAGNLRIPATTPMLQQP